MKLENIINLDELTEIEKRKKFYNTDELTDEQLNGELDFEPIIYGIYMQDNPGLASLINTPTNVLKDINASYWIVTDSNNNMGILFIPHYDYPNFVEVVLPISENKRGIDKEYIITTDSKTNKVGLYDIKLRKFVFEGYDNIEALSNVYLRSTMSPGINGYPKIEAFTYDYPNGYLLYKNDKVGFVSSRSNIFVEAKGQKREYLNTTFCSYNFSDATEIFETYEEYENFIESNVDKNLFEKNIPIEYDEIVPIKKTSDESIFLVKKNGLWGAWCYWLSSHSAHASICKSDPDSGIWIDFYYLTKNIIPPVFEKIDFNRIHENRIGEKRDMFTKVWFNGKVGILNSYDNKLLTPIAFDEITSYDGSYTKGIIDGMECMYDGKRFVSITEIKPEDQSIYVKVLKK